MIAAVYLAAIIAANLTITTFGPDATIPVAFVFIGLDLVARDRLHDRWTHHGRAGLTLRMLALIATGGALSYALNADAGRIALASCLAFTVAALMDAGIYHRLRHTHPMTRVNGSNIPAALIDSLLFPTIAFGALMPGIVAGQLAAKVLGGLAWALVLYRRSARAVTA